MVLAPQQKSPDESNGPRSITTGVFFLEQVPGLFPQLHNENTGASLTQEAVRPNSERGAERSSSSGTLSSLGPQTSTLPVCRVLSQLGGALTFQGVPTPQHCGCQPCRLGNGGPTPGNQRRLRNLPFYMQGRRTSSNSGNDFRKHFLTHSFIHSLSL